MKPGIRFALVAALLAIGFYLQHHLSRPDHGILSLLFSALAAGMLLVSPIAEAIVESRRALRKVRYHRVNGHYYEFHGAPIEVREDDDGHRWLNVHDVRRVVRDLPRDATLRVVQPDRVRARGRSAVLFIRADALADSLVRARDPDSIRFKLWVQREVLFPSPAARAERPVAAQLRVEPGQEA